MWDKNLEHEGETEDYHILSDLLEFGTLDTGSYGSKSDDYWITNIPPGTTINSETGYAFLELKSEYERCGACSGWAPRGQADWVELIEICDGPDQCSHSSADGIVWYVSVVKGGRSEMQLKNKFADGSESSWGMIANDSGQVTNTNWAPFSPLFFWKTGNATETVTRFWNQRDGQQEVVECEGATLPTTETSYILGRVKSEEGGETKYWKRGGCSGAECIGKNCHEMGLNIVCSGGEASDTATWSCNSGGAFYSTQRVFKPGDSVSCTLSGLESDYTCKDPASCIRSGIVVADDNHWWFEITKLADLSCDEPCDPLDNHCGSGLICSAAFGNVCRNPECPEVGAEDDCQCPSPPPICPPFFCKSQHTWEEIK